MRNAQANNRRVTEEIVHAGRRHRREFDDIDDRIDRLTLMCEAMWSLIEDNTALTTDDLERRIHDLDIADGRRDLRRQRTARPCECGAMVPISSLNCPFCGAPAMKDTPFDTV